MKLHDVSTFQLLPSCKKLKKETDGCLHVFTLTYAVGAAGLCRGNVLHVAMETEKDLNGVNLHLQSAGQVHHLNTHEQAVKLSAELQSTTLRCLCCVDALPCAPAADDRPPCRTRPAACARPPPAPTQSPRSPPDAPSGGTSPDLKTGGTTHTLNFEKINKIKFSEYLFLSTTVV